jgi:hypothetical protein
MEQSKLFTTAVGSLNFLRGFMLQKKEKVSQKTLFPAKEAFFCDQI